MQSGRGTRGIAIVLLIMTLTASCGSSTPAGPTAQPTTGQYSVAAIRAAWLKLVAEANDITNPPEVALVRYVTSDKEMESMRRKCMAEEGWPLNPEGGTVVPPGQQGAYNLASYTCGAKYQFDPAMSRPLTPKQQDILYDYWVNSAIPCIERHGYTVTGLPSREVFHAKYNVGDLGGWTPLGDALIQAGRDGEKLQEDCPEKPPFNTLYGSGGK